MTGNEARLNGNETGNKCFICLPISRAVASNSDAKTYAKTWHGFAGWLAYRLLSVANHHVGVVVCVRVVCGAGWGG